MVRSGKINLILAGLLVAVSTFAYWYEFKNKPERAHKDEQATKLISLDPKADVDSLSLIDNSNHLAVTMTCQKGCNLHEPNAQWEITSPIRFKADEGNVGSFISSISSVAITETISLDKNLEVQLSQYGLSRDKRENIKVSLQYKNQSQAYTVYFGDDTAVGDGVYVYVTGPNQPIDKIRIVPSYIKSNLKRGLTYWRDKHLLKFATEDVTGFKFVNSNGVTEFLRNGKKWFFADKTQADEEAINNFLSALHFINVKDWVTPKFLGKPAHTLTIKLSKDKPILLSIYETHQDKLLKTYATLSDKTDIVELEYSSIDKFSKKADFFRIKNILSTEEKEAARKIQLYLTSTLNQQYVFQSEDGTHWKPSPESAINQFNPESVNQALTKISNAKVAEFLGKKDISNETLKLSSWILKDKQGKELHRFTFYKNKKSGKEEYYSRLQTGEFVKLDLGQANQIPSKLTDFQMKLADSKKQK